MRKQLIASAAILLGLGFLPQAQAQETVFMSTQLRPIEEAQKVRDVILKGFAGQAVYVTEQPQQLNVRMRAEAAAGRRTVSVIGALHGELQPLQPMGALDDISDVAAKLADRGIPANLMSLGKLGGSTQAYIPWMQATYIMVANRQALPFLPAGADINALSYDQLKEWAKNVRERTGQRRLGFPAGPTGLMPRFFQGYLYPSYTGSAVSAFRSAEAEAMWTNFKDLWQYVQPNSTSYNFMQEPLLADEVWIAFDHVARVLDALRQRPNDFVTFPAPAGPKGRGYMPVVAGLSIAKDAPNRAGAVALIDHLSTARTQLVTAAEVGFFPVVKADLPADLAPGVRLAANAIALTQNARDALVSLLPIGLGDKGGEFNKVYIDTFTRIVLRNEPARAVLDREAENLRAIMNATAAPCWAPDPVSTGACPVN
ncbi:MAG: extracellular solute-binding protein [Rhodospirillales bacterium]|jgi:multiple sugar transport system substrate-binding protein|nr:ABC transporter substrate-binding protein [Magnetospirillum sp.]